MATISTLNTLSKTNVTAFNYLLVANSTTGSNHKFSLPSLFPAIQTKSGATGADLFVDITDKNVINFKGIRSANSILGITTATNDIVLTISAADIDLSNCDNTSSLFLTAANLTSDVSGVLPVANGGTNASSFADNAVILSQVSGTDTLRAVAMTTSGQLVIGGASGPQIATLTAGTNVTITNGDGSIEISAALASVLSTLDMSNNSIDLGTGYISSNGSAAGVRVTGNNLYVGASAGYFNSAVLNLSGGIDFVANSSHTIKVADGTTPGSLNIYGQSTTTTNGNGGNLNIYAGSADGSGTGGALNLYGGDTGSGSGGAVKIITSVSGAYTDAVTISGAGEVCIDNGDLEIAGTRKGLKISSAAAVTQATNHTTGVSINASVGVITLASVALNAAASAEFIITNDVASSTSIIFLTVHCPASATANATMVAQVSAVGSGAFKVRLSNPGAANTSTTAHKLNFFIINQ